MKRLLLVDDDKIVLSSLSNIFSKEGYSVLTAQSGSEALDTLKKSKVDILIMDHRMPDMTGLEAFKIIKKLYPDIIRIMITGDPDLTAFIPAIKNGDIEHYICKPWKYETLMFRLRMITQGHKVVEPLYSHHI